MRCAPPRGARPDVALERPGVRVHAHARDTDISVSIDLSVRACTDVVTGARPGGAAQGERRRGRAVALRLAGACAAGRGVSRSDVRLGYVVHLKRR